MVTTSRTDQIGSLIRPPQLLGAREMHKAGLMSKEELRGYEDAAILEALQLQKDVGIGVFSDGEMRRDSFMTNVSENVEGFEEHYPITEQKRPDGSTTLVEGHGKAVAGKLRSLRRIAGP